MASRTGSAGPKVGAREQVCHSASGETQGTQAIRGLVGAHGGRSAILGVARRRSDSFTSFFDSLVSDLLWQSRGPYSGMRGKPNLKAVSDDELLRLLI